MLLLCKQLLWQQQISNNLGFETVEEEIPDKGIATTESHLKFITIWSWEISIGITEFTFLKKTFQKTVYFLGTTENLINI